MLTTLLGAAVRGGALLAVVWVLLKTLRLRDPAVEKNTWTLVVAAALVMPLLSWVAGAAAPPLKLLPLELLLPASVASTAILTGAAPGVPGSRSALIGVFVYVVVTAVLLTRFMIGLWMGERLRRTASRVSRLQSGSIDVRVSAAILSPASFASTILLPTVYEA